LTFSCKAFAYDLSKLPSTSIIIVFHNEAWSTLLRTVHSVLNRSPHRLLAEIILVDDASERSFLRQPLDRYMTRLQQESQVPIHIVRSSKRIGLVQARLMGTRQAIAPVLTYLDAHIETTIGWLPPLLHRLYERPHTIVSPVIDVIHEQTFAYARSVDLHWGAINWALHFRWFAIGQQQIVRNRWVNRLYERRHRSAKPFDNDSWSQFEMKLDQLEEGIGSDWPATSGESMRLLQSTDGLVRPFKSPVMAGGLFSIRRDYFEQLGTYDEGMQVWGGENVELSLRAWSCGGRVETHPCSHVAHVFRRSSPYAFPGGVAHVLYTNLARVLHVWMEPRYQLLFYLLNEPLQRFMLEGEQPHKDVIGLLNDGRFQQLHDLFMNETRLAIKLPLLNQREQLKKKLKCRGFDWFLRHVWPQSFLPLSDRFFGQLKVSDGRCAQIPSADLGSSVGRLQLLPCGHQAYSAQLFVQGHSGTIRTDESLCVDVQATDKVRLGSTITLLPCSDNDRQRWIMTDDRLQHFESQLCVQAKSAHLELASCTDSATAASRLRGEPAKWWLWAVEADRNKSL
jgi:polypeptide N-acetylgalactosaminyltransferase